MIWGSGVEYNLTGIVYDKRRRGRQKTRITDGIQKLTGMTLARAVQQQEKE